jgi:hypothetical protein
MNKITKNLVERVKKQRIPWINKNKQSKIYIIPKIYKTIS